MMIDTWDNIINEINNRIIKNFINESNYKKSELENYKTDINKFIMSITENQTEKLKTESESEIMKQDLSKYFKKPWDKLNNVHKIVKIKEFIESLNFSKSNRVKIERELIKKLDSKKINKNDIIYDEELGRISTINNIKKLLK